ncbi:LeuA family protein [Enterococcus xiangfangensis]|uniref:Pyruvate carboxyltransferase domain-containing protein n=1 Tax=Enterococcus xiangfangensis TaxID=1296537 RepID=A0ABU3FCJ2_9ENTE|nr:hypothetical protein [Enterococcus xiangfangensis]MDT2760381.1 hypothetical protein [Enterococcus xiangfangensis]
MGYKEEGKWWVSPSNYAEEVTSKFNFPKKVEFIDTTLRDGEQQPGIILTKEEKIEIAKRLDKAGIQRIEAGTPAVLKADEEAIKEITKLGLKADIYCFVRNMKKDIDLAKECGVDGVIAEILGSEHLLNNGKRWTFEKAVSACIEATSYAHEQGLKVTFFPADGSRADIEFLLKLVGEVYRNGHIDSLALVDTFGVFSPEGAAFRVGQLKAEFPDLPIECHFHDDFGMAVSTTIAGLAAGAEVAHVTVAGVGERAGGAPLEATALSLEAIYGVDTGIDMTQFKELSEFVEKATRTPIHPTRPVVGDKIFLWETGLPSSLWMNVKDVNPLFMLPYHWSMTGHRMPELLLSKKSGKDNVKVWLDKIDETVTEEQFPELLLAVKELSLAEHRTLNEEDFRGLVEKIKA